MPAILDNIGYDPCSSYHRPADWWKTEDISYEIDSERGKLLQEPNIQSAYALEREFNRRGDRWESETAIHSSPGAKFLHKDLIWVLMQGRKIIPLILERLQSSGSDWFWALEQFAGEDVARNARSYEEAVKAWTNWWNEQRAMSNEMLVS